MDLNLLFINENYTVKDAIIKLDEVGTKILLVVTKKKLIGVVTDGDIRTWILRNGNLTESVSAMMNSKPVVVSENDRDRAINLMQQLMIESIPVVNRNFEVVDIVFWNQNFKRKLNFYNEITSPVVIMAGGKGTRLYPYTKILPKPLIPIGETPIVERIIERFTQYGFNRFFMTVNYKKNMIKAYFNEIDKSYEILFVEEDQPLGTAGSLSLLKTEIKETFFVSNCDVLLDANYSEILKYHKESGNKITMVTSLKNTIIPYGVIKIGNDESVSEIVEKPESSYLVNTGIYVLEPEVLMDVPENEFFHITDLINKYILENKKIGTYPVSERSWLDMGQMNEMENMVKQLGIEPV